MVATVQVSEIHEMDESATLRKIALTVQLHQALPRAIFLLLCNFPPNCTLVHAIT